MDTQRQVELNPKQTTGGATTRWGEASPTAATSRLAGAVLAAAVPAKICRQATTPPRPPGGSDDAIEGALGDLARSVADMHPELAGLRDDFRVRLDRTDEGHRLGYFRRGRGLAAEPYLLVVTGHGLAQGPRRVAVTVVHEVAHLLGHVRGQRDWSGGRHLGAFAINAQELGLIVETDGEVGYRTPAITAATEDVLRRELDAVRQAMGGNVQDIVLRHLRRETY